MILRGLGRSLSIFLLSSACGMMTEPPLSEESPAEATRAVMSSTPNKIQALALGGHQTCALLADSTVWCWGSNNRGQLGDGTFTDSVIPKQVSTSSQTILSNIGSIVAGGNHSCALRADGIPFCWGNNDYGALGNGVVGGWQPYPVQVNLPAGVFVTALAAGGRHSCALTTAGEVYCWGRNDYGQLGINSTAPTQGTPTLISGMTNVSAITAGQEHSCALLVNGQGKCWGGNYSGQLGNGGTGSSLVPVLVSTLSTATTISAGGHHTCASVFDAGNSIVKCWGENINGELGDGTSINRLTPNAVTDSTGSTLKGVVSAATGFGHSCAQTSAGELFCWGKNLNGQLGINSTVNSTRATRVKDATGTSFFSKATFVETGFYHTCAQQGETISCWGWNLYGQLGDGTNLDRVLPKKVTSPPDRLNINVANFGIAAGGNHSCGQLTNGTVKCWGRDDSGELGDGLPSGNHYRPKLVTGLVDAVGISAGGGAVDAGAQFQAHSCALRVDGKILCWGSDSNGQLGNGPGVVNSTEPVIVKSSDGVTDFSDAIEVRAGGKHTCALKSNGTVWCWGYNHAGQIGDGTMNTERYVPTQVKVVGGSPLTNIVSITTGDDHTCALNYQGAALCWGGNATGELGINDCGTTALAWPTGVKEADNTLLANVVSIAAGGRENNDHTCAVLTNGTVKCWGSDAEGQVGDGAILSLNNKVCAPKTIPSFLGVRSVSVGGRHSCALKGDGTVWCWGSNSTGQVGNSGGSSSAPLQVKSGVQGGTWLTSVVELDLGESHSCALVPDGKSYCWGLGSSGQLGNGEGGYSAGTPAHVLDFPFDNMAFYDATRLAPMCQSVQAECVSTDIVGRGPVGPELNQSNTINASCTDGISGVFHRDESIDRLEVYTLDGLPLTVGKTVRIEATVWAFSDFGWDILDLYYAKDTTANVIEWIYITSVIPVGSGKQVLAADHVLTSLFRNPVQAIRANFRYRGAESPCSSGAYDDRDDLIFTVNL